MIISIFRILKFTHSGSAHSLRSSKSPETSYSRPLLDVVIGITRIRDLINYTPSMYTMLSEIKYSNLETTYKPFLISPDWLKMASNTFIN